MEDQVTIKRYQLNLIVGVFGKFVTEQQNEDEATQKDREEIMKKLSKFLWDRDHDTDEEYILMRKPQ